jgi:hypothetical protein
MEAREVHFERRSIEAANQLDHLSFGTADVEAGQQKGNRIRTASGHWARTEQVKCQ